ncbi:TPA: hypothetical protein ACNEXD_004920, partial [Escherichia coli]
SVQVAKFSKPLQFYFCADPHNKPIVHPKVTTFTHLSQLPELWKARGWDITA